MKIGDTIRETIAGSFGGVCGTVVGFPLDTIKVRMQTQTNSTTMYYCAKTIMKAEGISSFFRGVTSPIFGAVPINAAYFMGYHYGKQIFWRENTVRDNEINRMAAAAGFSGFFVAPVYTVVDRLKCMLQVQRVNNIIPGKIFKGPVELFRYMYSNYGLSCCFRGFWVTIARDVPGSVFYFGAYDWIRAKLSKKDNLSVAGTMLAGGTGGVLYWLSIMPLDTIKTIVQVTTPEKRIKSRGALKVLVDIVKTKGFIGVSSLYRGLTPCIVRAFPSNAVCFLGYELMKLFLVKIL